VRVELVDDGVAGPRAISQRLTGNSAMKAIEREAEAPPERRVAEAGVDGSGDDEDESVVDDLHWW
jgi:hypothetical protein